MGDNGIKLSGGQIQRIAIARAILRKTPVIIFDEATSNLDNITEKRVMDYIRKISKDRIIIFIAHRMSSILYADNILVFKNGIIVEEGTHESLINLKEHYHRLFYRDANAINS